MRTHDIQPSFVPQRFREGTPMCLIHKDKQEREKIIIGFIHSGHNNIIVSGQMIQKTYCLRPEEFLARC